MLRHQKILFEGERPILVLNLINDDDGKTIGNITGGTAKVYIRKQGSNTNLFSDVDATITDGPEAEISYLFPSALAANSTGLYQGHVRVSIGAEIRYTEMFDIEVRPALS